MGRVVRPTLKSTSCIGLEVLMGLSTSFLLNEEPGGAQLNRTCSGRVA